MFAVDFSGQEPRQKAGIMAKHDTLEPVTDDQADTQTDTQSDELLVKAANMNIHRYTPHEKPGLYDDQVDTLIAVDEETGYQNSIEVLVPSGEVLKHKRYFSQSAAKRDKTSRVVNGEKGVPQGDGGVLLEFVLTQKMHRKPRTATATETPTSDTPEAVPAT